MATTKSNLLAGIEANLQKAVERTQPRDRIPSPPDCNRSLRQSLWTLKFELDGQIRACCLSKPFTYADLLKSIEHLFGEQTVDSLDTIRWVFLRENALRLPITNDDDLTKVIAVADSNGALKLRFLLTRKKGANRSVITALKKSDDGDALSDDGQPTDASLDSPPPGTIAPHRRHTATRSITGESCVSSDGGLFTPELVR